MLRKWSIDELPQLWNVLRGEMSLVGPRPFVVHESEQITGWAGRRLETTPGITGLWQVLGPQRHPVRGDGQARLHLRDELVALVGHQDPLPDAAGRPRTAGGLLMAIFVIPAFNEEANVPRLLEDLESRPALWRDGWVVLVDDGSSDGTVAAARAHDGRPAGRGALPDPQPGRRPGVRPRLPPCAGARARRRAHRHARVRHHERPRRARGDARDRPLGRRRGARVPSRRRRAGQRDRPPPLPLAGGGVRDPAHVRPRRAGPSRRSSASTARARCARPTSATATASSASPASPARPRC